MACLKDRAEPLRDAVHRHIIWRGEEARVVGPRLLGECLDARAGGEGRARFVETDVTVGADPQDLQGDATGIHDRCLVNLAGVRDPVEAPIGNPDARRIQPQWLDHLARDDRPVALRVGGVESHVLVEGEPANLGDIHAGERWNQRLIDRERRRPGRETEHEIGRRADASRNLVRNQLPARLAIRDDDYFSHGKEPLYRLLLQRR